MSDRTKIQRNKGDTSTVTNPSLASSTTPTLANPTHSLSLQSTTALSETSVQALSNQQDTQSPHEQLLEGEAFKQQPQGHDISRISLRPQAKLSTSQLGHTYEPETNWLTDHQGGIIPEVLQRKCAACEEEEELQRRIDSPIIQRDETSSLPPVPNYQLTPPSLLQPPDPATQYGLGLDLHLQLDPQLQAMQHVQQQLNPATIRPALNQINLGVLPTQGVTSPGTPNSTTPIPNPFASPTSPPAASPVPAGAGPDTPRAATAGDLVQAIMAVPAIDGALTSLQTQVGDRISQDWGKLRTGEQIGVVSSLVIIGGGALAGAISDPTARRFALDQLNGRMLPVPGLNWLHLEINTGGDNLMLGMHVDVGRLLPPSFGFGPSSPSAIGSPPQPEPLPGQRTIQRFADTSEAKPGQSLGQRIQQAASSGGSSLDKGVQQHLEQSLDTDLSGVQIHTDSEADRLSKSVNAIAFTTGKDIFFSEGSYNPSSSEGQHLIAHEVVHTVQQANGAVAGNITGNGVSISDPSDQFEQEAERVADRVMRMPETNSQSLVQRSHGHDFSQISISSQPVAVNPQRNEFELFPLTMPTQPSYLPSPILQRDVTSAPPSAPLASETPSHENQKVGTWGVWSKTPLTAGKREKEDFKTREAAIAYAKGMGKAAAVFQEDGKFIVYPVSYSSLIYSFTYSGTRMFNNSNISDVMGVAGVLALITEDGTAILPHQYGGDNDYKSWMEQQDALKPGENPFDAHKEAFGEGLSKITGKEKFVTQFELAMRDTVFSTLDKSKVEAEQKQKELANGLPVQDAEKIKSAATRLADVDRQLGTWKPKKRQLEENSHYDNPEGEGIQGTSSEQIRNEAKDKLPEAEQKVEELTTQRRVILLDYPLLSHLKEPDEFVGVTQSIEELPSIGFSKLSDADKAKALENAAGQVLKDIEETRKNVARGSLNLWALDPLVKTTLVGLGINDPERQNWAKDKAKQEKKIDTAITIALGVLQIGLAIAATALSGGVAGAAFAVGALGVGVVDATRMTNKYFQDKAAANTDINKDKALVPQDLEGQWAWLVVAWVGVGLSYVDVIKAVRAVKAGAGAAEVIASESSKLAKASGVEENIILKVGKAGQTTAPDQAGLRKLLLSALPDEKMVEKFKDIPVHVLEPEDFIKQFGSKSGEAVTTFKQGKDGELIAEVSFKKTGNPLAMREEAVHIAQSADKDMGAKLAKLSESNLSGWSKMETEQQLQLYKTKIEVEIDAQQRLLKQFAGGDSQYLANVEGNLKNLQSRLGEVEQAIKNPDLIKQGKMPWWDTKQPPRLFAKALAANSIVIDSNTAIALNKHLKGEKLQDGEIALIKQLETMGDVDLRIADQVVGEVRNGIIRFQGIVITVERSSPEYQKLLQVLEQANVGGGKGAADRQIVADVFFAKAESGVIPTYATHDPGQYNKLYKIKFGMEPHPRNPDLNGKSLVEAYKDKGFDVTINGKTIHVFPLPNK